MSDVKRMKVLVEISKMVTESDDFFKVKDIIVAKMLEVIQPSKACVNLFYGNDLSISHLVCSSTLDYISKVFPKNEEDGAEIDFSFYPEYIHEAVEKQKIILIEDVFKDSRAEVELNLAISEGYRGRIVFPFAIKGEPVGFMTCYLKDGEVLTEDEIDFISQVATLMSLSISITHKSKGIKGLINKLRTSMSNINKASKQLYSSQDMITYIGKMTSVMADTTESDYALANIYKMDEKGNPYGQELSISHPENKRNALNSIVPKIFAENKISGTIEGEFELAGGIKVKNMMYYKFVIDEERGLLVVCAGAEKYTIDDGNTMEIMSKQMIASIKSYTYSTNEEKHKALENDLSILKEQQKLIMSSANNINAYGDNEIFFYHEPSKLIGGDFYNAVEIDGKVLFMLSDVMGHGVVSNYIVALMKGAFDILSMSNKPPNEMLLDLNDHLYSEFDKMGIFATALTGIFDKENLTLTISNAGHYFPIFIYKDGTIETNQDGTRGIPIGILPESAYENIEYDLSDVKELCLFTDGILEMKNAQGEEFGIEKFADFLLKNENSSKDELLQNLKDEIGLFSYDETLDDMLVVFIKRFL